VRRTDEPARSPAGYLERFDVQRPDEVHRVSGLAELYDPASIRVLSGLGIEPDWQCIDAGCGAGTIAQWLAGQAFRGTTIACDVNGGILIAEPSETLRPMVCDITSADFPPESFNLIHARLLLQHLPDREHVLDRMVSWLAPGGWLVVADAFDLAAGSTTHPQYAQFHETLYRGLAAQPGTRPDWGRSYPEALLSRGLGDIGVEVVVHPVHGGGLNARLLSESLDRIPVQAVDGPGRSCVQAQLRDPEFWDLNFALVIARGRRRDRRIEH
jgi:SAM-dependent methyltransferase